MSSNVILILCIMFLLYLACKDDIEKFTSTKKQCNNIDDRCYTIHTEFPKDTHQEASDILAELNKFSIELLRHMREKYVWEKHDQAKYTMTNLLLQNYNPDRLIENNPPNSDNTSYVENKGLVYALCLRNKDKSGSSFIPLNDIKFVVLHEMAHMSTLEIGHENKEFWINFKVLITEAKLLGSYIPVDYKQTPMNYCSLHVDYNPYFDPLIK